jgi:hypothetical protein
MSDGACPDYGFATVHSRTHSQTEVIVAMHLKRERRIFSEDFENEGKNMIPFQNEIFN